MIHPGRQCCKLFVAMAVEREALKGVERLGREVIAPGDPLVDASGCHWMAVIGPEFSALSAETVRSRTLRL